MCGSVTGLGRGKHCAKRERQWRRRLDAVFSLAPATVVNCESDFTGGEGWGEGDK